MAVPAELNAKDIRIIRKQIELLELQAGIEDGGNRKTLTLVMASMLHRAVNASWAIVTDPQDEKTRAFYASFGFQPLTGSRQFIAMKSAAQWLSAQ